MSKGKEIKQESTKKKTSFIRSYKWDLMLVALVIVIGVGALIVQHSMMKTGRKVVVYIAGKESLSFSLDEDRTYRICASEKSDENEYNVLVIKSGQAYVSEADCSEQICVKHRAISKEGETIVCLPHKVVVEIE